MVHLTKLSETIRRCGLLTCAVLLVLNPGIRAFAEGLSCDPREQWYTGSLLSPSGTLSKGGFLAEPYFGGSVPVTTFDASGNAHQASGSSPRSLSNSTVLSYGLTESLTIQTAPGFGYNFDSVATSHGIVITDVPFTAKYRFIDSQPRACIPAVTLLATMTVPMGFYDRLKVAEEWGGGGLWQATLGLHGQMSFEMPNGDPLRIRAWIRATQPLSPTSVTGISVYGTAKDFQGHAYKRIGGDTGLSLEYGLTRHWVLSLDIVDTVNFGGKVSGYSYQNGKTTSHLNTTNTFSVAPAVEYNFTSKFGIILGVSVNPAGHNTTGVINPQIALNMLF